MIMTDTYIYLPQSYNCGAQTQPGFPNQFVADQSNMIPVDLAASTPEKTANFGSISRNLDYTSTVQCGNQPAWSGGKSISSVIDAADGMGDAFPPIAHHDPQQLPFSISRGDEGSGFFHPNFVSPFSTHYPTCLDYSPFSNAWAPPISTSMMNFDEQTTQSDMMMTGGTDDYILNNGETSPSAWNGFPGLVDPNQVFTRLQTTITPNDAKFVYSIPVNSSEEGNRRKRKRPDGTFSTNIGYKNKELLLVASGEAPIREDRNPQRHAGMRMRRSHRSPTSSSSHGDILTTGIVPQSEMMSLQISPESGIFSYPKNEICPKTIAFSDVLLQDVPGFQGPLAQSLHLKNMQQEIQEACSAIQQDTDSETMSAVSFSPEPQPSSTSAIPSRRLKTGPFRVQRSKPKRKGGDSRNATPEIPDHGIFGISQPCTTTDPGSHLIHLGCPFAVALPPDERVGRDCWQVHRKDLAGIKEHIGRSHIPDLHRNPVEHGDVIRNRARDWSTFFQKCYPGWGDSKNIPRPWVLWNLKTRTICTEREHYAHTPPGSLEELSAKYRVPLESPADKKSRSTPSQASSPRARASRSPDANPLQRIMAVLEMLTPHEELSDATARNWSAFINGVKPDELDAVVRLSDAFRANLHLLHQPTVTSSLRGNHLGNSPKTSWQSIDSPPRSQASTFATPSTGSQLTPSSCGLNKAGEYDALFKPIIPLALHSSGSPYSSKLPEISL